MKEVKYILYLIIPSFLLFSCEDDIMEWQDLEESQRITTADIPLELQEKIVRYDALNTYTDFVLGAGIVLDLYMNDETYRSIVNSNFDDVTVGYAMKHGAMVNAEGEINFEPIDNFIASTNDAGIDVYGHTLVWHTNQNASYLNSLIAPEVIPGVSGTNLLDIEGLQDASFTNWSLNNPGDGITVVDDEGLVSGTQAVELIAGTTSSQPYNLQLTTPDIAVVADHSYEISFYIKSDQSGQGRISFNENVTNQYPYKDWYGEGGEQTEYFETTAQYQQVKFTVDDLLEGATNFQFNFDLGYLPEVAYYLDVESMSVVDLDAEAGEGANLIVNNDFESGTLDGWTGYGNESTRSISEEGAGFGDEGYAMILTNPTAAQSYEAQQVYTLDTPLEEGTEYTFSFNIKANAEASIQVQLQNADYEADYSGGISVATTWTQVERTLTPTSADRNKFIFDFGEVATTYTIDNVVLTSGEVPDNSDPIIIELSDEEKAEIIGTSMEEWIRGMMTHYNDEVSAWDVVNEPMQESGILRDGNVADVADDDFYWVKYLGQDYAVTAFNLARQYGNPSNVLFINDYNLESSLAKCEGLIDYVEYIEAQGATVDGIGTQMHISLNTSRENITEMFSLLAASGKLIKVSELDVRLGTASPTQEQLAEQAAMYQFVVDSYKENIPEGQQYGITLWNISDNAQEHEFWLPEESPNVWDANYERKQAYKGVADGLAGRDVSEDFSGELE